MSEWVRATEDRERLGPLPMLLVALLIGASLRTALLAMPVVSTGRIFVDAAALSGVLAVFGLRSVPLRVIALCYAAIGGVLMAALGTLGDGTGIGSAATVLVWAAFTATALALCPAPSRQRRGAGEPAIVRTADAAPATGTGTGTGTGIVATARGAAVVVMSVLAVTLVVGPWAGRWATQKPASGDRPDPAAAGPSNALSYQDHLDMTRRPRLSDDVVMTVRSGLISFWRTATYDTWNRSTWTRSDIDDYRSVAEDGVLAPRPDDVAGSIGRPSKQQFHIESRYASALPIAPSAVVVRAHAQLLQFADGSLVAAEGIGHGTDYEVTSRQVPTTDEQLSRIDGSIPAAVLDRYAAPLPTTSRVRDLADQIVRGSGASNEYTRVRSLIRWMGANLTYSLDAPLAPRGVDVVDHFLFDSKQGWCEQIASSLVVMARQVGVPARLATGFAPGQYDAASGRFVVRERDAHAWAEVWFPGVGWVPFDPTATVPLAGDATAGVAPRAPFNFAAFAGVLVFAVAVSVAAAPLARRLHRWRRQWAEARRARRLAAQRWDVRAEQDLEELGRELGRSRGASETVTAHARELALLSGRSELAEQGRAVDEYRYGPPASSEGRR